MSTMSASAPDLSPEEMQVRLSADPLAGSPIIRTLKAQFRVEMKVLELVTSKYFPSFWSECKDRVTRQLSIHCEDGEGSSAIQEMFLNLSSTKLRNHPWIWEVARQYHYWANDMPCWPIPVLPKTWFRDTDFIIHSRQLVAAHIAVLTTVDKDKKLQHAPAQADRYKSYIADFIYLHPITLWNSVPEKYHCLLQRNHFPTHEWEVFIMLTSEMLRLKLSWADKIGPLVSDHNKRDWKPKVVSFTTDANEQARLEDDVTCSICLTAFADSPAGSESAVKTACGHMLGKECLQQWADLGSKTCPCCRQVLYDQKDLIKTFQRYEMDLNDAMIHISITLHEVNPFLIDGPQEFYPEPFYVLLDEMYKLCFYATSCWDALIKGMGLEPEWLVNRSYGSGALLHKDITLRWREATAPLTAWLNYEDAWRTADDKRASLLRVNRSWRTVS